MPYIAKENRRYLELNGPVLTAGELNYRLTKIIFEYFEHNGNNYQAINDVVGALEGCKLEFYRRVAVPYEDKKIVQNGDVY
jgi:hypothetical protein